MAKTRLVVAAKLSKALADRESGLTYDAGKQTVEEYLARWLSTASETQCAGGLTSGMRVSSGCI
jgi:hypothetical protein